METNLIPHESKMLESVRRWRKEVYESDQKLSKQERIKRENDLLRQFGLKSSKKSGQDRT